MPNLLTIEDLVELLKMAKRTVAEKVTKRKDFPKAYQIGSVRRWREDEILQWLESRR
jgi:predicted DNA-binding transcriptional regulator AlpA